MISGFNRTGALSSCWATSVGSDSVQINFCVVPAGRAVFAPGSLERFEGHGESVIDEQAPHKRLADSQQKLHGFSRLDQADNTRKDAQDSSLIATRREIRRGRLWIQASEAWADVRDESRHLTVEAEDAAVKHGLFQKDGCVVHQVCRRKVIRAADDDVVVFEDVEDIR